MVDETLGISLLTSLAFISNKEKYILIASNLYKAQQIYEFISSFLPKEEVLLFPNDELIRADTLTESKEMMANRLYVLDSLVNNKAKIVIASVASATRFLPNPLEFIAKTQYFKVNEHYKLKDIKAKLIKAGYNQVSKVDQSLQFASRGDILDVFSVNNDNPVRLEFFDDELESIRYFDIATQSSIKSINEVKILPATDFILSDEELTKVSDRIMDKVEKSQNVLGQSLFEKLRDLSMMDVENILEYNFSARLYRYYSLIQDNHYSIFDYCKDFNKVLIDLDSLKQSSLMLLEESSSYLEELYSSGRMLNCLAMFHDVSILFSRRNTIVTSLYKERDTDTVFQVNPVPFVSMKDGDSLNIIQNYHSDNCTVSICVSNKEQINFLIELFEDMSIPYEVVHDLDLPSQGKVGISIYNLNSGFYLPNEKIVFLTPKELFHSKTKVVRFHSKFKEATILKDYQELTPGDFVVHEYQGIGQFVELQTIEIDGVHRDYLKIAYYGDEMLYVPLSQFQLVRKYQGKEGASPRLSHLHSKDWENTKKKIKERVNDLANRLYNLYVERNKVQGFAFQKDDELQKEFEESFEYELTKDQKRALSEIKEDMESTSPMDRLLCGDVGFGKTEVAFSSIFKCILSGKQAAILCPTTLLAKQHYETALERFKGFDIKIAIFSRLVKESLQKEYIKKIQSGEIHLVIGTHRLLSKEIAFKDLGLLVIDEEQRFGVEQKEKIKELKTNIDVLSLSATPIPRTLQISLLGVRSLSQINTPPPNRMPIQTYVVPYDYNVVKELIERELGRQGQVFYLHNNVSTIYGFATRLAKTIPSARIGIAHGQMNRDEIEDVMDKFYSGDIDVLVCTTIIENGIDIPNANMIIVENSINYGLSQLYQIKGRVGRGDRIAYAYLMYNGNKPLNENARKRLKALQDFTELGSGYKIAQRDLMIRGAGDILGPEQAGFIDSIGLDIYIKLLNESVKEKIEGKELEEKLIEPNMSLCIDAYIPDQFAKEEDKIELYQEIMAASSLDSLAKLKTKIKDQYGSIPNSVDLLFTKREIDILKNEADIYSLKEMPKFFEIYLGDSYLTIKGIGNILFEALIPFLKYAKISYSNHKFKIILTKRSSWMKDLHKLLTTLNNISNVSLIGRVA